MVVIIVLFVGMLVVCFDCWMVILCVVVVCVFFVLWLGYVVYFLLFFVVCFVVGMLMLFIFVILIVCIGEIFSYDVVMEVSVLFVVGMMFGGFVGCFVINILMFVFGWCYVFDFIVFLCFVMGFVIYVCLLRFDVVCLDGDGVVMLCWKFLICGLLLVLFLVGVCVFVL